MNHRQFERQGQGACQQKKAERLLFLPANCSIREMVCSWYWFHLMVPHSLSQLAPATAMLELGIGLRTAKRHVPTAQRTSFMPTYDINRFLISVPPNILALKLPIRAKMVLAFLRQGGERTIKISHREISRVFNIDRKNIAQTLEILRRTREIRVYSVERISSTINPENSLNTASKRLKKHPIFHTPTDPSIAIF